MSDIWAVTNKGGNIVLWCDGLKSNGAGSAGKKRKASDGITSQSKKPQDASDRVQQLVEELRKQHGEKCTFMQYRLWSEMINSGIYKSTTDPPTTSVFKRCGGIIKDQLKRLW